MRLGFSSAEARVDKIRDEVTPAMMLAGARECQN